MPLATLRAKHAALVSVYTERSRRLRAATEARAIGYGGIRPGRPGDGDLAQHDWTRPTIVDEFVSIQRLDYSMLAKHGMDQPNRSVLDPRNRLTQVVGALPLEHRLRGETASPTVPEHEAVVCGLRDRAVLQCDPMVRTARQILRTTDRS